MMKRRSFLIGLCGAAIPSVTLADEIVAYTKSEGGHWIPKMIYDRVYENHPPAATLYQDGSIYDHVLERLIKDDPDMGISSAWRQL